MDFEEFEIWLQRDIAKHAFSRLGEGMIPWSRNDCVFRIQVLLHELTLLVEGFLHYGSVVLSS